MSDPAVQKLTATVGIPVEVELEANPSTGFGWRLVPEASLGLGLFQLEDLGPAIAASGKPRLVGAPVRWRWRVSPTHPGLVRLQFGYRRAWETVPPAKIHVIEIDVRR